MSIDNKARSYTNRRGEVVHVSQEHLDTAIEIKLELQKQSPSGKTSWARLKRMMEQEGFDNAESSENYRQMIKSEQDKQGLLPDVKKYANMVSENKLQSIKDAIGEMSIAKRAGQNTYRELNKMKREWSDRIILFEEIGEHLQSVEFNQEFEQLKPLKRTTNEMVVPMSDWHVGLITQDFNYEIAQERVKEYARNIVHYADVFSINTVHVAGLGDLLNGSYMRPNQLAENEFSFSEQIVKATELVYMFLQELSKNLNVVYLGSIIGNHSRMSSGAKNNAEEGDSGENVLDHVIHRYIEIAKNNRIVSDDRKQDNKAMAFEINGVKVKAVHGDLISKRSKEKLQQFISSDQEFYDVLLYGHFHHTNFAEENHARFAIGLGSLQGTTEFSKGLGYVTPPSQSVIILEGERIIPIRIQL